VQVGEEGVDHRGRGRDLDRLLEAALGHGGTVGN